MKIKDIKEKDVAALKTELVEKQRHIFDLRTQAVTEKLEDPTQIGKARKDIARIKTVIRQRELEVK
jgi:large subunit ribosomal protein L29